MDDFNTVYALLVLVMLFILLSRLDNRFGKIEKELNEIKKRMEDYLKVQQNSVAEASKPKEEISEKETKDIPVMPQAAEHVKAVKTGQREEAVQENTNRLLKQLSVRHWKRRLKRRLKQEWRKFA